MRIWLRPSEDWEIPDFKQLRWAPIAYNVEDDLYWLQCQTDEHGLTPVYYLNHDEATYCVLWGLTYGTSCGSCCRASWKGETTTGCLTATSY